MTPRTGRLGAALALAGLLAFAGPARSQTLEGPSAPAAPAPLAAATGGAPAGAATAATTAAAPGAVGEAPMLKILRYNVLDRRYGLGAPRPNATTADETAAATGCSAFAGDDNQSPQVLYGTGDIEIALDPASYEQERAYSRTSGKRTHLFLNGVDLADDAELVSVLRDAKCVRLRYHVAAGANSQGLWAMLFRSRGLTAQDELIAALGWPHTGPRSLLPVQPDRRVALSSPESVRAALAVVALILALSLWVFLFTDAFRDQPSPWWDRGAKDALRRYKRSGGGQPFDEWLQRHYAGRYDPRCRNGYLRAAEDALRGRMPADEDRDAQQQVFFGLMLRGRAWNKVHATYSLSRTQLGLWFAFAVCAAMFLWIVYGELRELDGSMLALLGLSVGTAGISMATDRGGPRNFTPSRGILKDLVMGGADEKEQVHRYQAVVVNLMLLVVGFRHVLENLTYPSFDSTWLSFLGISGVAYAAGKQLIENKTPAPAEPAAPAPAAPVAPVAPPPLPAAPAAAREPARDAEAEPALTADTDSEDTRS